MSSLQDRLNAIRANSEAKVEIKIEPKPKVEAVKATLTNEPKPEVKQETPFQRRVRLMKQTKAEQAQAEQDKSVEPKQPTLATVSKKQAAKPSIQGVIKTKTKFESAKPEVKMVPESEHSNKNLVNRVASLLQINASLQSDNVALKNRIESLMETNKQLVTEVEGMKEVEAKLNALSLRIVEVENANS